MMKRDDFPIITRRRLCSVISASLAATKLPSDAWAAVPRHPDWKTLEAGDVLWPAKPGDRILYGQGELASQQEAWERERVRLSGLLRATGHSEDVVAAERLLDMRLDQFRTLYLEDLPPGAVRPHSAGGDLRVGHVALVDVDGAGKTSVIEATPNTTQQYETFYKRLSNGVISTPLDVWARNHADFHVWQGRMERPALDRAKVAAVARQFIGRDYWFWNLDLGDTSSFYCSKLVWYSTWEALKWSLDGNTSSRRKFWLSPKQLMLSNNIRKLHIPAPYGG